jgi:hypothetical protein
MCSTRRTQDRFVASFRKPVVAAAAEVAGAAVVAEVAAAVAVVVAAASAVAAYPGAVAAFAKADCFPNRLTNKDRHGRVRQGRPGHLRVLRDAGRLADDGRMDLRFYREMPACALDEGMAVVGEYALHRRIGAADIGLADKMRVLKS